MNNQAPTATPPRLVRDIAREIHNDWRAQLRKHTERPIRVPGFMTYGLPYLEAMMQLRTTARSEKYGLEDAQMIILYFLNAVTAWRGDTARRIKAELKALLELQNPGE